MNAIALLYALLLAERHAHFRGKLRPDDENFTNFSLVSVMWSNFRHSFSFVNEN